MDTDAIRVEAREFEHRGSRLRYWLHGPPQGATVALTHGVSLDRHAFDAQVPALVAAGHQVLTWDIRGHGRSQPMGPGISLAQVADDLWAILDDVPVDRAVVAGQSFGGMVVQEALDRYPDRVAAMVVIGAPALGDRPGAVMRTLQRLRVRTVGLWPDGLLRKVFATLVAKDPAVRAYVAGATRQLDRAAFIAVSEAAMEGYLREVGTSTHGAPVLLVRGREEERAVARAMDRWARREPSARYAVIEGGHLVNQENPDGFNEVLLSFLAAQVPAR